MADAASPIDYNYRLDDRYTRRRGRVYLNGSQALVLLPLLQRERDRAAGLNTAGFISGYTGSPLGGYDLALKQATVHLADHDITFQPGVNEDLAATAVWGSQQATLMPGANRDGVFGIWYGKGPGVDRSGDALKHGSYAGTSPNGGVVVLAGDDHGAKSSTTAHQSDHAFVHFGMPYFNPATVQDYLDLGLYGFALSRYSGCWVGMKCVTDTVESSASVSIDPDRVTAVIPEDFELPEGGLSLRWGLLPPVAESRQYRQRLPAAQAFVRANGLDRVMIEADEPRLGIVTTGKAYLDVRQALDELGLDEAACRRLGVSLYKVAMPWPLEPEHATAFAGRHSEVLVVEEKRPVIEDQLVKLMYARDLRPVITGKCDRAGQPLLPADGELTPEVVALAIGRRLLAHLDDGALERRVGQIDAAFAKGAPVAAGLMRLPSFCAGCPHNTSTNVPDGSYAFGGIGCHGMAVWLPERHTLTLSQMGGEGAAWNGIAPFSDTPHIFQNMGDGTYYHSGTMAVRAAVAAGVNITYKILVNDAIAMTGGQQIAGQVRVDELSQQLYAEGVCRIAVVTDDPEHYPADARFAPGVTVDHRDRLDAIQRELREVPGVSAIIYDQYCATELRRRRKRGLADDPDRRTFIHPLVCEGCGDCSVQSNCIAIEPVETDFGRKRRINQSVCNKDFSCVKGYCPSFVTLHGATPRKRDDSAGTGGDPQIDALAMPEIAALDGPCNILVTGIGGSGVITLGALLGMAAHLEGKACSVLDVAGLAQRNGPVTSHIRIARHDGEIDATRIASNGTDLVLGCDIVVAAGSEGLSKIDGNRTRAVVNTFVAPTFAFASNPDLDLSPDAMVNAIAASAAESEFVDATRIAYALTGNAVAANLFVLGYAAQKGWLPVSLAALDRAIELNGVAVDMNRAAVGWGRLAACDRAAVEQAAGVADAAGQASNERSVGELVAQRAAFLTDYQNAAWAARYREVLERVRAVEAERVPGADALAKAVARYLFKLMAYKDEYEIARLYVDDSFMQMLREEFEGDLRIEFNLAPPSLGGRDPRTGRYPKRTFGSWMLPLFKVLAKLRFLRGTALDPFGRSAHRRSERALIDHYRAVVDELLDRLDADNHALAVEIASIPEHIRGYDVVRERHKCEAAEREAALLAQFRGEALRVYQPEIIEAG